MVEQYASVTNCPEEKGESEGTHRTKGILGCFKGQALTGLNCNPGYGILLTVVTGKLPNPL